MINWRTCLNFNFFKTIDLKWISSDFFFLNSNHMFFPKHVVQWLDQKQWIILLLIYLKYAHANDDDNNKAINSSLYDEICWPWSQRLCQILLYIIPVLSSSFHFFLHSCQQELEMMRKPFCKKDCLDQNAFVFPFENESKCKFWPYSIDTTIFNSII